MHVTSANNASHFNRDDRYFEFAWIRLSVWAAGCECERVTLEYIDSIWYQWQYNYFMVSNIWKPNFQTQIIIIVVGDSRKARGNEIRKWENHHTIIVIQFMILTFIYSLIFSFNLNGLLNFEQNKFESIPFITDISILYSYVHIILMNIYRNHCLLMPHTRQRLSGSRNYIKKKLSKTKLNTIFLMLHDANI